MNTPPGTSARSTRSSISHGVSMSRMIRSKPVSAQLGDVADVQRPGRARAAEERLDVAPGDRRRSPRAARTSAARPVRRRPPAAASRSARRSRRRPRAPWRRGRCRPSRRSARRPSGRSPGRRAAWTARSRTAAGAAPGRRCRRSEVTTLPSGSADQVVVRERRRGGCGTPCPAPATMVCIRPLGSVSWTRSPGRNGPRCTGGSAEVHGRRRFSAVTVSSSGRGSSERDEVRDAQHADAHLRPTSPGSSRARVASDGLQHGRVAVRRRPAGVGRVPASGPPSSTAHPGPRAPGTAAAARRVDQRHQSAGRSRRPTRAASGDRPRRGRRCASASGRAGRHRRRSGGPAGAASTSGSRRPTRPCRIDCAGAVPQGDADQQRERQRRSGASTAGDR